MSSEFHHDDEGTVVVEKGGRRFIKFHEEIYYANDEADHGSYVSFDPETSSHKCSSYRLFYH